MNRDEYGSRLPSWFHRANWAGGALACFAIGIYPLWPWTFGIATGAWAFFWFLMGLGAANNARLGLNSIHVPSRFRRKRGPSR